MTACGQFVAQIARQHPGRVRQDHDAHDNTALGSVLSRIFEVDRASQADRPVVNIDADFIAILVGNGIRFSQGLLVVFLRHFLLSQAIKDDEPTSEDRKPGRRVKFF